MNQLKNEEDRRQIDDDMKRLQTMHPNMEKITEHDMATKIAKMYLYTCTKNG